MISRVGSAAGNLFRTSDSMLDGIRSGSSGGSEGDFRSLSNKDRNRAIQAEKDVVAYQVADAEDDQDFDFDIFD